MTSEAADSRGTVDDALGKLPTFLRRPEDEDDLLQAEVPGRSTSASKTNASSWEDTEACGVEYSCDGGFDTNLLMSNDSQLSSENCLLKENKTNSYFDLNSSW